MFQHRISNNSSLQPRRHMSLQVLGHTSARGSLTAGVCWRLSKAGKQWQWNSYQTQDEKMHRFRLRLLLSFRPAPQQEQSSMWWTCKESTNHWCCVQTAFCSKTSFSHCSFKPPPPLIPSMFLCGTEPPSIRDPQWPPQPGAQIGNLYYGIWC